MRRKKTFSPYYQFNFYHKKTSQLNKYKKQLYTPCYYLEFVKLYHNLCLQKSSFTQGRKMPILVKIQDESIKSALY